MEPIFWIMSGLAGICFVYGAFGIVEHVLKGDPETDSKSIGTYVAVAGLGVTLIFGLIAVNGLR